MSKYTTEVRFICETLAGKDESVGGSSVNSIIEQARTKIFDFNFPIFDESYRSVLETKILKHFYTREIGLETYGLWKLKLETKLNEVMPYYNNLYKSELLEFNPFYDVDLTTDHVRDNDGSRNVTGQTNNDVVNTASGTTSGTDWQYYSDTPQGGINGLDSHTYLTNATKNTNNSNASSNSRTDNDTTMTDNTVYTDTVNYLEHVKGKRGGASFSKLLDEYRKTFINIDMMVIDDLNDLFMNLW